MYNNDDTVKHACRQMMALALLPSTIIEDTYDKILLTITVDLKNKLVDLIKYFQEQWLTKIPIQQWCVHGLSIRTNNNAEGKKYLFLQKIPFLFLF